MDKAILKSIAYSLLTLLVVGCSSPPEASKHDDAGFLPDYTLLQTDKDNNQKKVWMDPNAPVRQYHSIIIAPVESKLSPSLTQQGFRPDADLLNEVTDYMLEAFTREFSKHLKVVEKSGEGVMRFRSAITGINTSGGFESATDYLPFIAIAKAAGGDTATKAYVFMEAYYSDSISGSLIAQASQVGTGKDADSVKEIKLTDLKEVIDTWAQSAARNTRDVIESSSQ